MIHSPSHMVSIDSQACHFLATVDPDCADPTNRGSGVRYHRVTRRRQNKTSNTQESKQGSTSAWLAGCLGFVWVNAFSFVHCVASPFHSFVTKPGSTQQRTTARSSANQTKPDQMRYTLVKNTTILHIAKPKPRQRTHVARTQGCARDL